MFAIVISEKGGAERRESFDQDKVTVGRVQGNDLMLPKGNVSKRHCRVERQGARFVVTDEDSTNGTYVNRRRITAATVVQEGDRIYVGDFVLRIETGSEPLEVPIDSAVSEENLQRPRLVTSPDSDHEKPPEPAERRPQAPRPSRSPRTAAAKPLSSNRSPVAVGARPQVVTPLAKETNDRPRASRDAATDAEFKQLISAVTALIGHAENSLEPRLLDGEIDAMLRKRIEQLVDDAFNELVIEDALPSGIDEGRAKAAAVMELAGLGPLEALLQDPSVEEIAVSGPGHLAVFRGGALHRNELPFCAAASLPRVLLRLCRRAEVASPEGLSVGAIALSKLGFDLELLSGSVLLGGLGLRLSRRLHHAQSLEDLVRSGVVSRTMATFLRHCMVAQVNVLVVGPDRSGANDVLSALTYAVDGDRIMGLAPDDGPKGTYDNVAWLDTTEENVEAVLRSATHFAGHRLLVDGLQVARASALLSVIAEGAQGVLVRMRARSIERGLSRLCADIALRRPGLSPDVIADAFIAAFDLVLEVARLPDGRCRVVRIGELERVEGGLLKGNDIFDFEVERTATGGSIEGTFRSTGHSPHIASELKHHGLRVDGSLFSRPPTSDER